MASDKEHLGHCILFAFQLNKNPAEATEMICSALGEGAMTHKTSKKWFQRFRNGDFDLHDRERSGQSKNSKMRNWSNYWRKILLKRKKNLQTLSELLSKQFRASFILNF